MKIINEGTGKAWWHGVRITCEDCGRTVELEARDQHRSHVNIMSDHLNIVCECCFLQSPTIRRGGHADLLKIV